MAGKKRRKDDLGVFAPFVEETLRRFRFLIRDFGFEHSETTVISYECSVDFRKDGKVAVSVECEAGSLPGVMLTGRFDDGGRDRSEERALDYVIQHRCPERHLEIKSEFPSADEDVKRLLRHYASALRDCAPDFLRGDPSVIREARGAATRFKRWRSELRREQQQTASTKKR
jgi:hypothetical protein